MKTPPASEDTDGVFHAFTSCGTHHLSTTWPDWTDWRSAWLPAAIIAGAVAASAYPYYYGRGYGYCDDSPAYAYGPGPYAYYARPYHRHRYYRYW